MTENKKELKISLKRISGASNLKKTDVASMLTTIRFWIYDFYNQAAGTKKVAWNYQIEDFRGQTSKEFDLSYASDISIENLNELDSANYVFISDLLSFIEQLYLPVPKSVLLGQIQIEKLAKFGSIFNKISINLEKNNKINIKDLAKIENAEVRQKIVEYIDELINILNLKEETEELAEKTVDEEQTENIEEIFFEDQTQRKRKQYQDRQEDGGDIKEKPEEPKKEELKPQPQPTKLSELDPESRLYLQSLSIITINQALNRYFNAAALGKLGLPPNTRITFDQLPLETRRQLMDRSFVQVENLLFDGRYSIEQLIKNPSQRISFSSQSALGLITDLRGLNLLNQAAREIVLSQNKQEKITQNQEKELKDTNLKQRIKNKDKNILSSKDAEKLLEEAGSKKDPASTKFFKDLEDFISSSSSEVNLDNELKRQLSEILGDREPTKINEAANNIVPFIDLFIQQGLPPEYLIPDPNNFDYNRFVNIFGKTLDEKEFNEHRQELANLITFYWKRKRAIWSREIRQEFGVEKYTPEQAQALFEKISGDGEAKKRIEIIAKTNLIYGGREVAQAQASGSPIGGDKSKELDQFLEYQKELIEKYLREHLEKLDKENQSKSIKAYVQYYQPETDYEVYNLAVFEKQVLPQISPMDFYMLQAAEVMGARSFTRDGSGFAQQAFLKGKNLGSEFVDSSVGQAATGLAAEVIGDALYLVPGLGEALLALGPAGKQVVKGGIQEFLNKLLEYWYITLPLIILSALLSFLMGILPALLVMGSAYLIYRNGLAGLQKLASSTQTIFRNIGETFGVGRASLPAETTLSKVGASSTTTTTGKVALSKLTPAMEIAGKAVVTTIVATGTLAYIYQSNLNSAFLTHFPLNESEYLSSVEKKSKYAEMSKTARIIKGCSDPENDDRKCENPSFPVSIEYTITISPKEDFSIQITDISDELKFKQSAKGWEEEGKLAPAISSGRNLGFDYFQEIIEEQGGMSSGNLQDNENTSEADDATDITTAATTNIVEEKNIIILPDQELTFTYTIDDLGEIYDHTAILNTIEVNFYYENDYLAGTDNMITAARVCLGNCSAGSGCWPTTGNIWQLPFGEGTSDKDTTHRPPSAGGWGDSYDIGCDGCSAAAIYGPEVYVQYDGELCFIKCDDDQYGCRYILEFDDNGTTRYIDYAHFQEPMSDLSTPNTCKQVSAGELINLMSNRGIGGVHLHFGTVVNKNPGNWYVSKVNSIITELMPETDNGNKPAQLKDHVTTCY